MRYACRASAESFCTASGDSAAPPRMSRQPKYGPIVVPNELNACVRFNRLDAVSGGPSTDTYAFAATCNAVIPAASTISAPRNSANDGALAAGINSSAPPPIVTSPATIVFLYPIVSISLADGIEKIKYAEKNANCTSITLV